MQPLVIDGVRYLVSGCVLRPTAVPYLRFPVDENDGIEGYMRLRATLFDPALYTQIARRLCRLGDAGGGGQRGVGAKLTQSTVKVGDMFAMAVSVHSPNSSRARGESPSRKRRPQPILKVLEHALLGAYQISRERAGLKPVAVMSKRCNSWRDSLNAINDSYAYGGPVYLQLTGYEEVQASGLQLTRSPGKNIGLHRPRCC